jgi:hypothetical protein
MAKSKKKTSSVEDTTRESAQKKAEEIVEKERQTESKHSALAVPLSPVQLQQINILASLNNDSPGEYAKKVLGQYIADRLYLLR